MKRTLVTLALVALLLSGCVGEGPRDEEEDAPPAKPSLQEILLGPHPLPSPDGAATSVWLQDFVTRFPLRVTGTPTEVDAGAHITAALQDMGYTVDVMAFTPAGLPLPGDPVRALRAIVATLPGTERSDHWLAFGGHYDTAPSTIEGAYDNGSGVALALELARMLKDVEINHTRAVILFNGEEEGTQASDAFVAWYEGQNDFTIDLFIGLDMVGIAYPAPGRPLAFFSDNVYAPEFVPLARAVAFDLLGLPDDNVSVTINGRNTRNSDEAQFATAGIATMRLAGLQKAGDYWGYHKVNDTMETIHAMTAGAANFEAGLANTAAFVYAMLVALDVRGVPESPA